MKKLLFCFLSIFLLLGLGGCQKERSPENSPCLTDVVTTRLYLGVKVVNSEAYGTYLSFRDKSIFESVLDTFNESSSEFREMWSEKIGFISMNKIQNNAMEDLGKDPSAINLYPNEEFASLLNPEGYIMINGVLYQDTDNGKTVYIVHKNGTKAVHFAEAQKSNYSKISCRRGDDSSVQSAHRCNNIPMNTYQINAKLYYWTNWVTGYEYLYARSYQQIGNCNTANWSLAYGTISFKGDYDLTVDGNAVSGQINASYGNRAFVRHEIAQGKDVCINEVSMTHSGQYGGTGRGATTTTSL